MESGPGGAAVARIKNPARRTTLFGNARLTGSIVRPLDSNQELLQPAFGTRRRW